MFLLIRDWDPGKPQMISKPDEFIQLVDPPVLKKREEMLLGTDDPADLESIPKGKETRLPPIPRSEGPAGRGRSALAPPAVPSLPGMSGRGSPAVPEVETKPQPAPIPGPSAPSVPPVESGQDPAPAPGLPGQPPGLEGDPSTQPSLPLNEGTEGSLGSLRGPGAPGAPFGGRGEGGTGSSSREGGLPGLPFADSKSLDRLAKAFSDREPASPKDSVSINTEELKYFSYWLKVKNKIEYIGRYPEIAAQRGVEGDLFVNFTIHRDGRVTDIAILSSSGYDFLDREAVRALTVASPFAPLPDAWNEDHITITGHFIYRQRIIYLN